MRRVIAWPSPPGRALAQCTIAPMSAPKAGPMPKKRTTYTNSLNCRTLRYTAIPIPFAFSTASSIAPTM